MIEYTVKVYPNGSKFWWLNEELHREDGPAIEWLDGTKEWYLNGVELSEQDFNTRMNTKELTINQIEELLVGDKWYIKIRDSQTLSEVKIIEVTEKTVLLSWENLIKTRYKKMDIEFVEKVKECNK